MGRPWVLMDVTGTSPEFSSRLIADLRAGLAPSRIDACMEVPVRRGQLLATVKIAAQPEPPNRFSIDVSDAVTQKRIGRDVDLSHVPSDGRAFALAVAAEELLRASWAELALSREKATLRTEREATQPAAAATGPAPPPAPRRAESRLHALGVRVGFEHYTGGQTQFGADLFWIHPGLGWMAFGLGLGARRALAVDAATGTISATALGGDVSLRPRLLSAGVLNLDGVLALRIAQVYFSGSPAGGGVGHDSASTVLYGRAGVSLAVGRRGSVRSLSELGAGAPLRSFSASEAGEIVTGVSGVEVFASTGVALEF